MRFSRTITIVLMTMLATLPALVGCDPHSAPQEKSQTKPQQIEVINKEPDRGWPLFRGNTHSTGVSNSQLPDQPEVIWKFKAPNAGFESTAAIIAESADPAKQTVYIADIHNDFTDSKLFAIDLKTGELRWEYQPDADSGFSSSPAVSDGKIYIGDIDGTFFCIDEQGNEVWKQTTTGEINACANFYQDLVLIGSQDSILYAFEKSTGDLRWKFETGDQIQSSITIAGKRAFVAGCDALLRVVDVTNGKEAGSIDIRSPTGATPAVLDDQIFLGTQQGDFFALDWRRMNKRWKKVIGEQGTAIRSCAAVTHDHVIFGSHNRSLYSLNPKTGKKLWSTRLKTKIDTSPVIVDKRVWVAANDGRLYSISLADGDILWEKQFNGGFIGSPAVAFGKLVVATERGVVYCLGSKSAAGQPAQREIDDD